MANKTLLTYKDRLINFSGRNQTLCRNKLYAVRAFDLVRLKQVKENIPEEILMSLINDDENEHKILKRATDLELSKEEISYIENNYIKMLDKKAVTLEFDKIQIEILKQGTDDKLKKKVIEILKEEKLKEKIDMYHKISLNLDKLFNEIDTKERETGLYELYTGFPFIEGKLLDGKNVRAPLFLFPSSIIKRDGEWYYKNLNKEKIYINRVFLMAYKDSNKISIEHIEEEYEEVEEFFKDENKIKKISDFLEKCRKWGENNNIKIKNDLFVDNFELMKDYRKESYNNYKDGELFLRNNFILGQYSVGSNVIYKDIEEMAKEEELPESVEYFLKEDINSIESYGEGNAFFNKSSIEISEKESFFITDLDYSQEKAVKMAEISDNLVIYGPPGTGKSQVIANIVSDYIAKGKKVLVVSEKSTALAVVYKRLEKVGLNSRIAFIHDSKRDRKSLLEKIVSNYETVVSEELNENVNIHDKSDEIQNKIDRLDKLKNELYKERKYKVSLYKLYTHSKLNKSFLEDIVTNFENYNFFDFYSLRELLKKMQQIKEYIKYDSKETLVSTRKSFSETSGLVKKLILEKLEILEKLIENSSLNSLNIKIKEFIENINIENIWKERNKEFVLLYDDAEELILKLNDYENIRNSKTEKLGREIIETIEDKQILSENCKRIFEKILKLNDKTIINQIMEFEEVYIKLDEYNTELEKKISNINIEKYWKENNKELSALYDNADILLENIIKYENIKKRKIEVVGFSEAELNNRENQEILNEKKSLFDELIKVENSNELFNNVLNFEEKYIELKNIYQQTEEYLKRIDIEEIWKYENKGNEIIYDNVESIRKELLEYEYIIKNKKNSIGISEECIKKEEDSELLINRTKNIFESILNSDKREELIKEVLRLEENFNLLQKYQNKANENINKINIEEIWKENNFKEKEIYDNVEKMYEKIERFNKCFFISPQKFKLKKEILNYNKEKNITEIKESIEKVYNEKKINKHIEEIIKNNSTSVLEKLNLILEKVFLNIKDRDLLDENREELKTLQEKINSSKELISDRVDAIEEIMEEIRKKDGMFYIQLVIYKLKQSIGKYFSDEKVFNKREFIEKINLEKEVNKKMQEKLQSKELNILSKIRLIINEINILPDDKNKLKNTLENIEKLEEKTDIEKEIINKNIIESEKLIEKIKESKGLFYFDLMCYLLKKEVSKYFNENSLNNKKIIVQKVIDDKVKNIEVAKKISEIDTSILEKSEIIINNICLSSEDKEQLLTMMKNINTNNESIEKLIGSIKGKYKEIDEISNEIKKKDGMFYFNLVVYLLKSEIRKYFRDDSIDGKKLLIQNVLFEKISNKRIQENILNKEIEVLKRAEIVLKEVELNTAEKEVLAEKILNLEKIENIVESISEYFNDSFIEMLKYSENSISLNSLIETITNEFELIKIYDVKKVNFNEREKIILDNFVKNNSKNYLESLENTYYLKWIEEIEKEIGDTLLTIDDYHSLKTDAFSLIKEKRKIVPEYILNKLNEKIKSNFQFNRAGNEIYYKNLIVEANKKRKMLSLRKYIEIFIENGIFDIVPCWLLTPEVVSEILPYQKEYFDIVIFDEASQMFVEKSVPSIFRAKKVIVAGDDKQLKPSAIGVKRSEDEEEDESNEMDEEYKDDSAVTTQSLLDLAKARYNDTLLSYHYRSKYPELINFSNYAFYNGNLITAPNKEILDKPPIEVIKLNNGIWENQSNIVEAENVYKVVKELLLTREKNESIGIVTFNAKQQSTIKEYLDNICESDIEFRKIYEQEKIRYDGTEDQSLFVKNIENVQGDERDIIIFSTAYAKDIKTGRIANRFGTLSQEGGENRLNVAISRAKVKIIIITSIEPEELDVENTKNNGPKLLKKYLQYCRAVSQKDMESAKKILESLDFIKEINQNEVDKFDSPFEEEVCDKLRNNNFIVHTQVGDSGYKIDLAIYDKSTLDYILGIECDGATYHSSPSARERDIYRQKFLEMKGWNIHRIWSKHWWENPDKEIDKIIKKVNRITG